MRTVVLVVTGLLGTVGAATLAFPQAAKLWRDRDDGGVSTAMYAIYIADTTIWTGWGIIEGLPFVWISNGIALVGGIATVAGLARLRGAKVVPLASLGAVAGLAVVALARLARTETIGLAEEAA